ncbi:MAG: nitroreductase family protein [Anaerolineales bacterium]
MESFANFWQAIERLASDHQLVIDRPRGSAHPHLKEFIYPLDYGYLEGCRTSDGAAVDVWRGSLSSPQVSALFISIDMGKGDIELKIALGTTEQENQLIYECMTKIGLIVLRLSPTIDAQECLKTRRSVRYFQEWKIDHQIIEQILELAQWAPSAHNTQPWRFVVLENESTRQKLAEALGESFRQDLLHEGISSVEIEARVERSRRRIIQAPAAILLCLAEEDIPTTTSIAQQAGERIMALQSVALAGGQLMLAAHTFGVSSVWLCAPLYAPQVAQRVLDLPVTWQPQALILLGYAAQTPLPPTRKSLDEVVRFL